jgi:hypothetical protein
MQWAESAADCIGDDFLDLAVRHLEAPGYVELTQRETPARDALTRDIETAIQRYALAIVGRKD